MSNFKEKYWWVFPIWRAIFYSFCMAILWALPILIFGGVISHIFYLFEKPPPTSDDYYFESWFIVILLTVLLGLICSILGAISGLCAGIRAPASEPRNPFKSKFFRTVSKHTFFFLLISIVFFYFNMVLLSSLLDQKLRFYDTNLSGFWLIGSILGYFFGIRQALTNAFTQSKQAAKID